MDQTGKESSIPQIPLYLPGFILQIDATTNERFLFHSRSGEIILGCQHDGNVEYIDRRYSFWTRPSEPYTLSVQIKEDRLAIHEAERKWFTYHNKNKYDSTSTTCLENNKLLKEGLVGYYGPRIAKRMAIERLQNFARSIIAKAIVRSRVYDLYQKIFDENSNYFFFLQKFTGHTRWHRPFGLGCNAAYDLPEKILKPKEPPVVKIANQARKNIIRVGTYPSTNHLTNARITEGPYFTRIPDQPSRNVKRSILHSANDLTVTIQRTKGDIVHHPKDIPNDTIGFGTILKSHDGFEFKEIALDPYTLLRAAYENGVRRVVSIMKKYEKNKHVIRFGSIMLAKYEFLENDQGLATEEALEVRDLCLHILSEWMNEEYISILAASVNVLVSLTDIYANRIALNEANWIEKISNRLENLQPRDQTESGRGGVSFMSLLFQ